MIAQDHDRAGVEAIPSAGQATIPAGLPDRAAVASLALPCGEPLVMLTVPLHDADGAEPATAAITELVRGWVDEPAATPTADRRAGTLVVPLYGCLVAWAPGRAAAVGPTERISQLGAALAEFADLEARLRDVERRAAAALDHAESDAVLGIESFDQPDTARRDVAGRYREAVAMRRSLALLAPAIHAAPSHPPTLVSQLGERLRERGRLAERHALAAERAELVERVAEACAQRLLDAGIARRQTSLEWTIVVLLVVQTALVLVDLLAARASP